MSAGDILVSVHIITYNHEQYIEEAINNVLAQDVDFNIELIVSNDCSTDNTNNRIERVINNHPKAVIKYYNQPQRLGMMPNFLFTLKQCSGKYIAVCEGDDYWIDTNKLKKQVAFLEANTDASMVFTNRKVVSGAGEEREERYETAYGKKEFTTTDVLRGFVPGMQTIMFRNDPSIIVNFESHSQLRYGDRYLAYWCSLKGDLYLLKDITAVYRMTGRGAWSSNDAARKLIHYTEFMNEFYTSLGIQKNDFIKKLNKSTALTIFRYCLKRPKYFLQPEYRKMIGHYFS